MEGDCANQILVLKDSEPARWGKDLRKMFSHPNLKPLSNKTQQWLLVVSFKVMAPLFVAGWEGVGYCWEAVRLHFRCLLSLQHIPLDMLVNFHWQTYLVERATITLKSSLVILFVISERFSSQCVLKAMTKEALQSTAAGHGTHIFNRMREGLSWQSLPPLSHVKGSQLV